MLMSSCHCPPRSQLSGLIGIILKRCFFICLFVFYFLFYFLVFRSYYESSPLQAQRLADICSHPGAWFQPPPRPPSPIPALLVMKTEAQEVLALEPRRDRDGSLEVFVISDQGVICFS